MSPSRLTIAAAAATLSTIALVGCSSTSDTSSTPATSSAPSATDTSAKPPKLGKPGKPATTRATTPDSPHPTEFNPPGDIPDNAVFVDHVAPGSRVHFTVPEGWARRTTDGVTTYTDKYNSISIEIRRVRQAPTVASARRVDVPELRRTVSNFQAGPITEVTREHGKAVHLAYLMDSGPSPVTGRVVRDAVERFEFWKAGDEAILSLSGPQGADNVDPWQIVSDSLHWQ
jgi:hypothetical protein